MAERKGRPPARKIVARAEFVKMLADKAKANGGIFCPEQHKRQPVARAK